jgi:FMN phosphatase YigB (HAD superfamily)
MPEPAPIVFLLDVDNTLLDNDRVISDLRAHLSEAFGHIKQEGYWKHFEEIRDERGYADYLGALQRYRAENPHDPHLLGISSYLLHYPFRDRLYTGAIDLIAHLHRLGTPVILSDGDVVFQPWKVERSGIFDAIEGRVLIYVHKELELADVESRFPASYYVLIDDKLRILTAVKKQWGPKVSTIFVRQGHYARDPEILQSCPAADIAVDHIADVLSLSFSAFQPK